MIDGFIIKLLGVKNEILSAGIARRKREKFTSNAEEIYQNLNRWDRTELFHILLHSHYDPAWFARRNITRKMLGSFYKKVAKLMDDNPEYKFTADSQTQVLEDILSNFPERKKNVFSKKLSEYIADGRLVVGPYYAGIDLNMSSSAVLRRNIQFGMADARKFGWNGSYTGWMIDQFGFPAQMWQLHKKFGIESIILWRGLGLKPDEAKAEVLLESPDGSRILGKWLFVQGYRFGLYVGKYADIGVPRLIQESEKIKKYTVSKHLLIMDGYEGEDSPDNPERVIQMMRDLGGNVKMSTPDIFMSELLKDVKGKDLPVVRGYQNFGYYSPVLKGVVSARQYIKQAHQLCDDTLVKLADPLAVFADYLNIEQDWCGLENMWRDLIRMASHDELGGCGIDDIHRDSFKVYKKIFSNSTSSINRNMKILSQVVNTEFKGDYIPVLLFNTLPFERSDTVGLEIDLPLSWNQFHVFDHDGQEYEIQLINIIERLKEKNRLKVILRFDEAHKLPAFGYKTLFFTNNGKKSDKPDSGILAGDRWMENSRIRVDMNDNGTFDLVNKDTGRIFQGMGYIRVEPDGGDTYDFSHIKNHSVITSLDKKAEIELEYKGNLEVQYKVLYRMMVPSSITEDRSSWSEKKKPLEVSLFLTLRKDSPRLDLKVLLKNTLKESRIRICFPVETDADELFVNRQFDVHKIPFMDTGLSVDEKRDIHKHMNGMISSGMDVVDAKSNINFKWIDIPVISGRRSPVEESLGIINRDNFEFEIRNNEGEGRVVEFTLLRSVGWNARADLLTRNINAGWEIYTPDAFCFGEYMFSFSVLPHSGGWEKGRLQAEVDKKDADVLSFVAGKQKGFLPCEYSLFKTDAKTIVVSEITNAEKNSSRISYVLYNPSENTESIVFTFNPVVKSAFIADLNGNPVGKVVSGGRNEFSISLRKKEILELYVDLENSSEEISSSLDEFSIKGKKNIEDKAGSSMLEARLGLKMKPSVTVEEVVYEKKRWMACRKQYRKSLSNKKDLDRLLKLDDFIKKYREEEAVINQENTVKEAHYSYLLTLKRYYETVGKESAALRVERSIAKMARELIDLRVKKREAEIYRIFFENLKR